MNLIVGLGNPGKKYANTRHNIGFMVVDELARIKNILFKKEAKFKGEIAKAAAEEIFVLKPLTYMNLSGESVRAVTDYYQIPLENILVVSDDFALPFGELRLRPGGSSGGQNGLKSIEEELQTNQYPRLRFGIGSPNGQPAEDYVLEAFTKAEEKALTEIIERAVNAIETWLTLGIEKAMMTVNRKI